MTGPSEESAPGHPQQAAEGPPGFFSEDRTDSAPHPDASGAYDVQPTQAVNPPNPATSGPYQVPNYGYDHNLPPLQPQYAYPQPQGAGGLPQPQGSAQPTGGRHELSTAHLVMPGGHPGDVFIAHADEELRGRFRVGHATLQVETGDPRFPCPLAPESVVLSGGVPPAILIGTGSGAAPLAADNSRLAPSGGNTMCTFGAMASPAASREAKR